jgi:hypothetical protein
LKAKLGVAYAETCAAFIWATIQRMYAARNSGLKKEMFGYVRGGYANVLRKFSDVLTEKGVDIRLSSPVGEIEEIEGRINLTSREQTEEFDKVILTCPSNIAAKILPQLTSAEKERLNNIRYLGIICASVLSKKPISEYYVTNITDETPFTGVIELSALVDKKEFGGNSLIYLPRYLAPDHEWFDKPDEEIKEHFLSSLEKMYAHFDRKDVLEFKISRVRQVFPLLTFQGSYYPHSSVFHFRQPFYQKFPQADSARPLRFRKHRRQRCREFPAPAELRASAANPGRYSFPAESVRQFREKPARKPVRRRVRRRAVRP